MRISVVNLTSDSSDNEDPDRSTVNDSKYTCEKGSDLQSAQKFLCENEQCDAVQRVPLFKIIFKDESTSRIYRKRLEDITKYLVSAKLGEDSESNSRDLILEIYEPIENSNTTFDIRAEELSENPVIDNNQNYALAFNSEKEMNNETITRGVDGQNNHVLFTKSFDHTNQPVNMFDAFNRGIQQCLQQQELQQSIVQSELPSPENLNTRKRKWVDDSDLTTQKKKKRVECASECMSHLQNKSDTLENLETSASRAPYYDPVWWDSSNKPLEKTGDSSFQVQVTSGSVMNEESSTTFTYETNVSRAPYYDPIWWRNDSSNKLNTPVKSVSLEKTKVSNFQAQATTNSVRNEKSSTTFTYRVLKVGTFDYTTKRTFFISKDGIQLCAHHLDETSTLVKVNIEISNLVKIEVSFSQILPALFLYINEKAAMIIKEALGINNDSTAYLDPRSPDENCNKIIILPDHITENSRVLKNLLKVGLMNKLDKESAGTMLRNSFSKTLERQSLQNQQLANELLLNITSHSVRIGTYKCSNARFNVMISIQGFQFQMPKVGDDEIYKNITVDFTEIDKLYFSLKKVSALFLHVNSYCAQRIRSLIEMSETDADELYFDPDSETIAEQRLVFVFNKIKPYQQETLKTLLSYTQSAEISLDKIVHQMLFNHM